MFFPICHTFIAYRWRNFIVIDCEAGKIVLSVHLSVNSRSQGQRSRSKFKVKIKGQGQRLSSRCHFSTGAEWSKVVFGKSNEIQIRYTLKNIVVLISRGAQNGCLCNLLLFRQNGHLRLITLLILNLVGH